MTYDYLISEISLCDAKPIQNKGKSWLYRQLPFVTVRLDEGSLLSCKYKATQNAAQADERLKVCRKELNALCDLIEQDPASMQLFTSIPDERCKTIHAFVDQDARDMLFLTYTTYSNATVEYENDLAFLKDVKLYIQRRSQLFNYSIKSVDTFGVIYHLEKNADEEEDEQEEE